MRKTYLTTYDAAGRVASAGDGSYDFEYTYSVFGQLTSTTQDLAGLSDDVVFTNAYDVLGRKTSGAAKIGSTDDYVNTYAYDALGRVTQITQAGVTGGNAFAEKRVDFTYSDDNPRSANLVSSSGFLIGASGTYWPVPVEIARYWGHASVLFGTEYGGAQATRTFYRGRNLAGP